VLTPSTPVASAWVAPNPVSGDAFFKLENLRGNTTLEVFAADGKRVFCKSWLAISHDVVRAPLVGCSTGLYFWKVSSESGVASGKLVKE
jgi:hypothetical protein